LASTYFFVWSINGNVSLYTDLSKLRSLIKELYVVWDWFNCKNKV